jgi:hypothetical protein
MAIAEYLQPSAEDLEQSVNTSKLAQNQSSIEHSMVFQDHKIKQGVRISGYCCSASLSQDCLG